jgi:DNA-binding response OmpR family regulator
LARILIVEDEESNRLLLTEALEYGGHQVTPAVDGIEALEKISCPPPDLVITDILMPRKGGVELIKEIRWSHPDMKILAIAAMGESVLDEAREAGADRMLKKPYHLGELLAVVEALLAESR